MTAPVSLADYRSDRRAVDAALERSERCRLDNAARLDRLYERALGDALPSGLADEIYRIANDLRHYRTRNG